jgi:hypothetical protein
MNMGSDPSRTLRLEWTLLISALPLFYTLYSGLLSDHPSKGIDARFLYVAGLCLLDGISPYDVESFTARWETTFNIPKHGPFVFFPPSLLLSLAMAPLPFETALVVLDVIMGGATVMLYVLLWRLALRIRAASCSRIETQIWIALGISLGAISGSLLVGQPTVFVALGLAFMALSWPAGSGKWLISGLFCCIKPHISFVPFIVASWSSVRTWQGHARVGVALALIATFALVVSLGVAQDYLDALQTHRTEPLSNLVFYWELLGLPGALKIMTPLSALILGTALIAGFLFAATSPAAETSNRFLWLFSGSVIGGVMLFSHKFYDMAVYAVPVVVMVSLPLKLRIICLIPIVLVCKPNLVLALGMDKPMQLVSINAAALFLFALFATLAMNGRFQSRNTQP